MSARETNKVFASSHWQDAVEAVGNENSRVHWNAAVTELSTVTPRSVLSKNEARIPRPSFVKIARVSTGGAGAVLRRIDFTRVVAALYAVTPAVDTRTSKQPSEVERNTKLPDKDVEVGEKLKDDGTKVAALMGSGTPGAQATRVAVTEAVTAPKGTESRENVNRLSVRPSRVDVGCRYTVACVWTKTTSRQQSVEPVVLVASILSSEASFCSKSLDKQKTSYRISDSKLGIVILT